MVACAGRCRALARALVLPARSAALVKLGKALVKSSAPEAVDAKMERVRYSARRRRSSARSSNSFADDLGPTRCEHGACTVLRCLLVPLHASKNHLVFELAVCKTLGHGHSPTPSSKKHHYKRI